MYTHSHFKQQQVLVLCCVCNKVLSTYEIANYEDFVCNLYSCGLEATAHVLFGRQSVTVLNTIPAVENERSSTHTHITHNHEVI